MTSPSSSPARVDVCICTYRRPDRLRTAVGSVLRQTPPPGVRMGLLVADNDETPSAESEVRALAAAHGVEIAYRHAPARNISLARNACLEAAPGDWLAFLDDDEVAGAGWLQRLFETADAEGADVVFGPSLAVYTDVTPGWIRAGDYHTSRPVAVGGELRSGISGNVLIRCGDRRFSNLRFDPALGRSGGEDTDFFHRVWRSGARLAYAPKAEVFELVPDGRLSFLWLARRRFRGGQTHAALEAVEGRGPLRRLVAAGLKLVACAAGAALTVWSPTRSRWWLLRGALHLGALAGSLGVPELQLY